MLLSAERLFTLAQDQRLPALLIASRKHQNVVSNKLSGQVMEALFDLLRGFQSAHDQTGVLTEVLRDDPNQVYAGLLTVLLRLVFILYAEDRDLLSSDETFVNSYSVGGLFERLREDEAHHPDTMDQRYGAWARLVVLFRLIYKGARHGKLNIPGRKGYLFDPDRYPFLEGGPNAATQEIQMPRVPDGVLYRVLRQLLILDGERLSYRNLDVEQIGSVYEAMMGFELHVAKGPSIALKPKRRNGAPITINLVEALAIAGSKRNDWLNKEADQKLTGQAERALKEASSIEDLMAALDRRIAKNVTPTIVPAAAMIFQPSAERRRSGSHYTPRSLTQPIVEAALAPVLKNLGENPKPEQILALKVCDPAMGSGAFLVEACRQLGDALVQAWHQHNETPILPPDEDELLHARRLVAQRCLYGVDKNVMAVDLAKLSLWLATLARDHEFTFLDHALRHGDTLVGFSARQVAAFGWEPKAQETLVQERVRTDLARVADGRREILNAQDGTSYALLAHKLGLLKEKLKIARNLGDVLISAFFAGKNGRTRENGRQVLLRDVDLAFGAKPDAEAGVRLEKIGSELRARAEPVIPFHWELEFPEVFVLDRSLRPLNGFDIFVGNPPFQGGKLISSVLGDEYNDFLKDAFEDSKGAADLCAYFFRRAFGLLNQAGTMGLLATNTIAQADTREVGLDWIASQDGIIYSAISRYVWPGIANVHVSVLHISKLVGIPSRLNGKAVAGITTYLTAGSNVSLTRPVRLAENFPRASGGTGLLGIGFVVDPSLYEEWISGDERYREILWPYMNGRELNSMFEDVPQRYVINFADRDEQAAESYPLAIERVRLLVKPERDKLTKQIHEKCYWKHWDKRADLYEAIRGLRRVLVCSFVSTHLPFRFLPADWTYSKELVVIPTEDAQDFALLQSNAHSLWARLQSGTLKSDLSYSISDALRTFPLPKGEFLGVRQAGEAFYQRRDGVMRLRREGLTAVYNRFHNPDERSSEITELRRLHEAMDRAVLDAYGWTGIPTSCEFTPEFDEDDEDDEDGRPTPAKQRKYRFRWPDEVHDEVLARLLALNGERAALQSQIANPRSAIVKPVTQRRRKVDMNFEKEPALFE